MGAAEMGKVLGVAMMAVMSLTAVATGQDVPSTDVVQRNLGALNDISTQVSRLSTERGPCISSLQRALSAGTAWPTDSVSSSGKSQR